MGDAPAHGCFSTVYFIAMQIAMFREREMRLRKYAIVKFKSFIVVFIKHFVAVYRNEEKLSEEKLRPPQF